MVKIEVLLHSRLSGTTVAKCYDYIDVEEFLLALLGELGKLPKGLYAVSAVVVASDEGRVN